MKRLIAFVLFLITLVSLTGCHAPLAVIDLDAELDQFIHGCIMNRNKGHQHEEDNGYANESHEVLGTEASGNQITIYAWVLYRRWKEESGTVEDVSGSDIPTAITVEAQPDGTYKLIEYWEPRDGSYYQKDLKAKFPRKIRAALEIIAESKNRFNATQQDAEMYFFGGVQNDAPASDSSQIETVNSSYIDNTEKQQVEEPGQLDVFMQQAFEMDLKEFQSPQPTYAPEDPDRSLKESIDRYLYARNSILADIKQPFSTKDALTDMLSCCDASFYMEAKVTIWYLFYMRKIQDRDLSYEDFRHRTTYQSIEYEGNLATIHVKDSIQFMTVGTDDVSASGDIHVIIAEQVDGKWLIIHDDPGQIEGYINDAFHKFRSECPYSDEKEIETYIMDRFATWGNDPLPPYTITG